MPPRAETPTERKRREALACGDLIAFAACSHGPGRLLRVAQSDARAHRIECPVKGCVAGAHRTFMPRPRSARERCDLAVDPTTPDPEGDPGSGQRQVSDAAIFEAIPADRDVLALEVSRELGYASVKATPLITRVRAINRRAEEKGARPPFALTTKRGCPTLIRRVEQEVK